MAGDRRATEGYSIAHRAMDKVFPADRWSAVAIAGAAGPAVEMVRLFQVQLEHYEKVEGISLSLEGKANQLAQMVRQHLPMAMQGFVVVPLFAGYDTARGTGRIFSYDATGGPDLVRGIYPLIAVVDAEGYRPVPEDEVAERFGALIARARADRAEQSGSTS